MTTPPVPTPDDLIERLRQRGITDDEVLEVIRRVPRHRFVEPGLRALAYDDRPLPSAHSPPLPQPYVVALVVSAVKSCNRRRVLEIGTDSGYVVAILAELFDEAYTIERHRDVATRAMRLLERLGVEVKVQCSDGSDGWREHAPYDAIVVMAGAIRPPPALVDQLAEGGILVIPVGPQPLTQRLTAFTKTAAGLERRDLGPVSFVPLVGAGGWGPEYSVQPVVKTGTAIIEQLRAAAHPMAGIAPQNLTAVIDKIADARVVLLGGSTNGTSEFQRVRATLTSELLQHHGFDIVAWDADWSYGAHVHDFVTGDDDGPTHPEAFAPSAWHNEETLRFLADLRHLNQARPPEEHVRCYGLDLFASDHAIDQMTPSLRNGEVQEMEGTTGILDRVAAMASLANPAADTPSTGHDDPAATHRTSAAEEKVTAMLRGLLEARLETATAGPANEAFMTTAAVERAIRRGDRFYDALSRRDPTAWLLREEQVALTLDRILSQHPDTSRVVVWTHNVHAGDSRATGLADRRLRNLAQYVRERHGQAAYSLGMGTYTGNVFVSPGAGQRGEARPLPAAAPKSHEHLCHATGLSSFFIDLSDPRLGFLSSARAQRAIGGVRALDAPLTEHYLTARLNPQFDGYVWFERTEATRPLPPATLPNAHLLRA